MVIMYNSNRMSIGASASEASKAIKQSYSENKEIICLKTDEAIASLIEMIEKINWK